MIDVGAEGQSSPITTNVLEFGTKSEKLRALQAFFGIPQTGEFDDATHEAIRGFQQGMNLEVTGNMNLETFRALGLMASGATGLTWFDWALIYAFEYKWWVIGAGIGVAGGVGYWLYRRSRRKR